MVDETTADAIRRAWDEGGELSAITKRSPGGSTRGAGARAELRRHFPLITDGADARRCVHAIVGWKQRPGPDGGEP